MRNFFNSEENEKQKLTVLYPAHEEAFALIFNESFPIKNILVGITYPMSYYRVNRTATNKLYLFEYVLEGKGEININGKWQTLQAGDTYIIDKSDRHNFRSDAKNPLKKIWISFSSEYIDAMFANYNIQTGIYRVNTKNSFLEIYNIAKSNATSQSKFFIIADNIHHIITAVAATLVSTAIDELSVIKNELIASIYTKCTLEDIATKLFMSKSNLIRRFKKHTNMTPYNFLLNEKMKVAKTLLETTTLSIKSISDQLCFTNEHYFSFLFKEKNGVTPSKFRNLSSPKS